MLRTPFGCLLIALTSGSLCVPGEVGAQPREVFIIRHAEKPLDENDVHLNQAGRNRAEAIPKLFQKSDTRPDPLPKPDFLFAAKNSKHSHRTVETIAPLAKKLKMDIDTRFDSEDFAILAKEVLTNPRYANKTIFISWRHGHIPDLARALKATDAPDNWKDRVFDQIWTITYGAGGKAMFAKHQQALMPGDGKE
ncbi:MAG TPA: hypothetical protein VHR66_01350 [Gemmataceae bacterium]|jgi:broad specificity phosphatase PhoE|nr:hypothetical protein [Gemmataceae bacterium]